MLHPKFRIVSHFAHPFQKFFHMWSNHAEFDEEAGRTNTWLVEIKSDVLVNFWGTLLSTRPLPKNERGCCYVRTGEDWGFTGESSTLVDYVMEHPPLEKKQTQVR